ncbi:MAG: methyltransferase domain-containing protein, partial [Planctomycetota bacterium]|nr:methyltransferase domain-containing protein [Planctomycetota bacterium]
MKPSSRARLTRFTVADFPGDTLFDAVGRVVSEAACLPRKELFEAWAVAKRVHRRLVGRPIVDLAAGHGLLAHLLLLLDPTAPGARCVDRRRPQSADAREAAREGLGHALSGEAL